MSLRRRLVVGMLVLLVAGHHHHRRGHVVVAAVLLFGRLDEQIDVAQDQAYSYIDDDLRAGPGRGRLRTPDEQTRLASGWRSLGQPRAPVTASPASPPAPTVATPSTRPRAPRPLSSVVLAAPDSAPTSTSRSSTPTAGSCSSARRVRPATRIRRPGAAPGRCAGPTRARLATVRKPATAPTCPTGPPSTCPPRATAGATYRVEAVAVPGGTLVTAVPLDPTDQTLASLIHVEVHRVDRRGPGPARSWPCGSSASACARWRT